MKWTDVPRILEGTIPQAREPPTIDENECTPEDTFLTMFNEVNKHNFNNITEIDPDIRVAAKSSSRISIILMPIVRLNYCVNGKG